MKTLQDRLCQYLIDKGLQEVKSSSKKYRQFKPTNPDDRMFYYIGKVGAWRKGPNVSTSHSICSNTASFLSKHGY
jgi:hypothetical protein